MDHAYLFADDDEALDETGETNEDEDEDEDEKEKEDSDDEEF